MLVTLRGDVVNDVVSGTSQDTNYETTVVVILDGYWEGIKSVSECLTAVLKSYHLHLSNYRCKVHTKYKNTKGKNHTDLQVLAAGIGVLY